MSKLKYICSVLVLCNVIFFSCKIGSKYQRPVMDGMPHSFEAKGLEEGEAADIGWSTLYKDSVLQNMITKALDHNRDVLIATARINEMIANKRISFANIFPEIGIDGVAQKEHLNYGGNNPKYTPEIHTNLTFGWEVDIWGKLRWANDAAIASYMQSVEAQQALRLTIIAEVAQSYFKLRALDRELEIVKQTLEALQESAHFAKLRHEGGLTSEMPYRQSLVEVARTEPLIPSLENEIKLMENNMSVLLGEFPSGIPRSNTDISTHSILPGLPVDVPSSLLERRPDVIQAEQKLIEANAKVGVALTSILPSLNLTGRLGAENSELTDFLKSPAWFIGSSLAGPIFNMGKNKAIHQAAKAAYQQEVYSYEKTILSVFMEVNNAINTYQKTQEVRKSRETLYSSVRSYQKLARLQYVNGIVSYMDVLDAQRQLFDAEITLNNAILDELTSTVQLYKALGGGLVK
ncbi:multidrug efflux system outer membrane protein [Dysgonomonas alginatilytica]|uniref:Multidrug efflux system outer membrane protein n=1 Tax=Dysgonomonas alginatilytica TaxID=1605892 RepID=A0A2V3PUL8_9BACT|nr:efflux transporter outer membrane subunit [Dysgonomonas alginatilytica]PXV67984.1 multidrug efflux system outer membrane protein [Dysgonomonas alginatilytica]